MSAVTLNWTASAGAASYNVYQGTASGGEVLVQSGLTSPTASVGGLNPGVQYFFQVTAVNAGGESPVSNEVSTAASPPPPTALVATRGDARVSLTWTAAAGATSYNVYYGIGSGGETLLRTGVTTTSFTVGSLTNGTTYFFQVTAVSGGRESVRSNEASARPAAPPPPPTNLVVTQNGSGSLILSWTAAPGATTYAVYRGIAPGGEGNKPVIKSTAATTATFTGLVNGTTYYFQVTSIASGLTGARSVEASGTPGP